MRRSLVLVDPSVNRSIYGSNETKDTFVAKGRPSENFYLSNYLYTGSTTNNNYGLCRTYIKFDIPADVMNKQVTTAYIKIRKTANGKAPSLNAYRVTSNWTSQSVTWNNKPSNSTVPDGQSSSVGNNWYEIYITDLAKKWCNGTYSNYGVLLQDTKETSTSQWTEFYSSDTQPPNRPEFHIVYNDTSFNNPSPTARACGRVNIKVRLASNSSIYANLEITVNPATSQTPGIESGCVYMIKNVSNGRYLAVDGLSSLTLVVSKNAMDGRQLWYVEWTGSGYKLYSMGNKDSASYGRYESLLQGRPIWHGLGFASEKGSSITWSIDKYNGYYYLTNTALDYRNSSLSSSKASARSVTCLGLEDESEYARWSFEKIPTQTFNNYYPEGYYGYKKGDTIYFKISIDEESFNNPNKNKLYKRSDFDILKSQNNPWNNITKVVIYGPGEEPPGWVNPIPVNIRFAGLSANTIGETVAVDGSGHEIPYGFNMVWFGANIKLRGKDPESASAYTELNRQKIILHELGHVLQLAHPKEAEHLASVPSGRGSYPIASGYYSPRICAIMNQGFPDLKDDRYLKTDYVAAIPKWHDIINLKNRWD